MENISAENPQWGICELSGDKVLANGSQKLENVVLSWIWMLHIKQLFFIVCIVCDMLEATC